MDKKNRTEYKQVRHAVLQHVRFIRGMRPSAHRPGGGTLINCICLKQPFHFLYKVHFWDYEKQL